MECLRCGNDNNAFFYKDKDIYYCRKCIHFGRVNVGELPVAIQYKPIVKKCSIHLDYSLTKHQKECVQKLKELVNGKNRVLVYAACGAGKTEIVMDSIMRYINEGKRVGFAISRRQVVLEIRERLAKAFPMLDVIAVCEGYTSVVDGDVIVCTMHQLYRYHQTFDLLIMDEIDAFPYANNIVLEKVAHHACKGAFLYLTATPSKEMLKEIENQTIQSVELFVRPHGFPLVIPKLKIMPHFLQLFYVVYLLMKIKGQILLFVPTIQEANRLRYILMMFKPLVMTSKTADKEKVMTSFSNKEANLLIATTILERGITIPNVHVIILHSEHAVFKEASLIQMVGRVGRKKEAPTGYAYYIASTCTKDMKQSIHAMKEMNKDV